MSVIQKIYAALQQEGYRPLIGDDGSLIFRYFGQPGAFRSRSLGQVMLAELECNLPCPELENATKQIFLASHPLCRLSGRGGQALLTLETMLIEQEAALQLRSLLRLLDQYSADLFWNRAGAAVVSEAGHQTAAPTERPEPEHEQPRQEQPAYEPPKQQQSTEQFSTPRGAVQPESQATSHLEGRQLEGTPPPVREEPVGEEMPAGWEQIWPLLNSRYHALGRALAQRGVPAPQEVQMDMLQGQQVRGSAIMMWGTPPDAVVICEQGQVIPAGYQGGTWYKHQTAEQVAEETLAHLRAARHL